MAHDVRDLMSTPVITIAPHTRLPAIKRLMTEHGVGHLPVVGAHGILGIITRSDVRNAFPSDAPAAADRQRCDWLERVRAEEIMRVDVVTVGPDASVLAAAQLFLTRRVSGLPVVDHGRVIGMLTKSDICRALHDGRLVLADPRLAPTLEPA